jgi:Dyp-type peroxidase family
MTPSFDNVQGLIVRPYKHAHSRHLLLQIEDAAAGRKLLKELSSLVTPATDWGQRPSRLLNLGITYNGLKALKVNPTILDGESGWKNGFAQEFKSSGGKNPDSRDLAGFTGDSAPSQWWQGAQPSFTSADIHLILHLYAISGEELNEFTAEIRNRFPAQIRELKPLAGGQTIDGCRLPGGKDHFGYADGISQPKINWPKMNGSPDSDFREFLLGYATLNTFQSEPPGPFARDGSYMVFQLIYQNVAYFNQVLKKESQNQLIPAGVSDKQEWIAAKLVGRWRSGAPLIVAPIVDDPTKATQNNFGYVNDLQGYRCPLSAHIRVSHPRDQAINSIAKPPRLIRRGIPYGLPLTSETDDGVDRGLVGLFICASIDRQYLRLARWINRNDFSHIYPDKYAQDPIQGNRDIANASPNFRIPAPNGGGIVLQGLKSFVRTKGAAFCFLPSLRTISDLGVGKYT